MEKSCSRSSQLADKGCSRPLSKQLKHEAAALPLGEALGPNDTLRIPYDYAYKSALNRVFMNTWSKSTFEYPNERNSQVVEKSFTSSLS